MKPRQQVADWALPLFIGACLLLGGASAAGALANFALQCAAAAIIVLLAIRQVRSGPDASRGKRGILILAACLALLPLIQLVPLPPALWQHLPGREVVAALDPLFGGPFARPLSLQPGRTLSTVAALLPPVAALLLTLASGERARHLALLATIAIALLSAFVGTLQILGGPQSSLYFYAITNDNTSVGFFANSNHLSTLFLVALVFTADLPHGGASPRQAKAWTLLRVGLAIFLGASILLNRSLAGIVLLGPALLFWAARQPAVAMRLRATRRGVLIGFGAVAGAGYVALAAAMAQSPALHRLMAGFTIPSERMLFTRHTLEAAADMFPVGSGLGTFQAVYAGREGPAGVTTVFVNHAHNDYAEFLLEAGIAAPLLLVGLAAWIGSRLAAWRRDGRAAPHEGIAAAVALALIALHSLVDYPLRTAGLGALGAMCLGLLVYRAVTPAAASAAR